ncbi:hypothetical protein FRC12_011831 [Ceratobasidium sp. 428]|nr:hypothetical protein FRC12_011831 [Ceratobasidium sp. 428]
MPRYVAQPRPHSHRTRHSSLSGPRLPAHACGSLPTLAQARQPLSYISTPCSPVYVIWRAPQPAFERGTPSCAPGPPLLCCQMVLVPYPRLPVHPTAPVRIMNGDARRRRFIHIPTFPTIAPSPPPLITGPER